MRKVFLKCCTPFVIVYSIPFRTAGGLAYLAVLCIRVGWREMEMFIEKLTGEEK